MKSQQVEIAFYKRVFNAGTEWIDSSDWTSVDAMLDSLRAELAKFDIDLKIVNESTELVIKGYGDILNSVRVRYPSGGFGNTCLGHIVGKSANCDLAADLKRGINRVLFAPETIEPQGSDKVVCHNCGCGC